MVVVEMQVARVLQIAGQAEYLMVLRDGAGERLLPIGIGPGEAMAIAVGIDGTAAPRPMAHDLLLSLVAHLDASLDRVIIHDLRQHTFIAQLEVRSRFGVVEIDCRPSDGVAAAVRANCPILVDESVLEQAGVGPEELPDSDPEPPVWD